MYTSAYKSTKLLRNSFQIATDREIMGEIEDSFVAIGPSEIGFWAGGAMARSKIGALLRGTDIGCVGIVGREKILLNNEIKGFYGLAGESDAGDGVRGVSSGDSHDDCGVSGEHINSGDGVRGLSSAPIGVRAGIGVRGITLGGDIGVIGEGRESTPSGDLHLIIGVKGLSYSRIGFGVYGENLATITGDKGSNDGVRGVTWSNGYTKGNRIPWSKDENEGTGAGVVGINNGSGSGVVGWSNLGDGILGMAERKDSLEMDRHGVHGISNYHYGSGVWGENTGNGIGVKGSANSKASAGVLGNNDGIGPGVAGRSSKGEGVVGQGTTNGMHGIAPGSENEHSTIPSGVWGENTGDGIGVKGSANGGIGVLGVSNSDTGVGISGINHAGGSGVNGESVDGAGVVGGSLRGYGGDFSGGLAPIRLKPGPTSGRPTDNNHSVGELYLDNAGNLFLCITAGTPGSWAQIQIQPVP